MDIPVKVIYDILNASPLFKKIPMYFNQIEEKTIQKRVIPLIRITELPATYNDTYASNLPTAVVSTIQVDLWVNTLQDANSYYYEIDKLLAQHGVMLSTGGVDYDPDYKTTRIYKRYTLAQTINFA